MNASDGGHALLRAEEEPRPARRARRLKKVVFAFPLLASALFLAAKVFLPAGYRHLVREDSPLEYAQAVMYLAAFALALRTALRFRRRRFPWLALAYAGLGSAFLFIFLEEISWGQRIFHFASSEFFRLHNKKREITLHNLWVFQFWLNHAYLAVGLYGAVAWRFARRLRGDARRLAGYFVPDWFLSLYFFGVFCFYFYMEYVAKFAVGVLGLEAFRVGKFVKVRDQETAEFVLALGFLLFALVNERRSRSEGVAAAAAAGKRRAAGTRS